jgi:O-antigen/teichoic acid export membrane protein
MKRRIIHDISASSLQVIVNQLAGLMIFFIATKYLSKTIFGELSWALAILMVMSTRTHEGLALQSLFAIGLFGTCLFVCGQIRLHDWVTCKRVMYA